MAELEANARGKILRLIDERREEIIRFTQEYIRIKSVNPFTAAPEEPGDESTVQRWIRDQFEAFGIFDKVDYWEVEKDRPNVVGVAKGDGEGSALIFNGHSDVVPVPKETLAMWHVDPWGAEIKEGRLYGRGSSDMKGGNSAMIWAARLLHDAGIKLRGDLLITLNIAEESAQHEIGIDSIIDRGYTAPFWINVEPTNMEVQPVTAGLLYFKLTVPGQGAHIGFRHRCVHPTPYGIEPPGVSAIDKMTKFILAFQELERLWGLSKKHPLLAPGQCCLNPALLKGGEYFASTAASCEVTYSVTFNADERGEDVITEIKEFVDRISRNDYWLAQNPPKLEIPYLQEVFPPVNVPVDHEGCKTLAAAFEMATGRDVKFGGFPIVCDANWAWVKGQRTVIFGPGDLSFGSHGANEYVPIDQLVDACKVYACMMIDWCGVSKIE